MIKRLLGLLIIALLSFVAAKEPNVTPIKVEISIEYDNNNPPSFIGKTNLPDGMRFIFSIKKLSEDTHYFAQKNITVKNGRFDAGPFSFRRIGVPLPEGSYEVGVDSPHARMMDESVREIIGEEGELLRGKFVVTSFGSEIIDYKMLFNIN